MPMLLNKMLADTRGAKGRLAMAALGLAGGVFALTTMLFGFSVLTREISSNYLATNPASIFISLNALDHETLSEIRRLPGIADVEATATVDAKARTAGGEWLPAKIFVIPDPEAWNISRAFPHAGTWPLPAGSIQLEKEALALAGSKIGDSLLLKLNEQTESKALISGTLHDPALAPAWQEQALYVYATPDTMAVLGAKTALNTLKVTIDGHADKLSEVDKIAATIAAWLQARGHTVESVRVPPRMHPHQKQMTATLKMLLGFGVLALALGAVLSASLIGNLLAQQVPQIGIMKAVGARRWQIMSPYIGMVALIALAALAIGVPSGLGAGNMLADRSTRMLNFSIASRQMPLWAWVMLLSSALIFPLLAAWIPIHSASRITVRDAIDATGVRSHEFGTGRMDVWLSKLTTPSRLLLLSIRNSFRRKQRLALTISLLAVSGALFIGSLNLKSAWEKSLVQAADARRYDIEVILNAQVQTQPAIEQILRIPGVHTVESWEFAAAARTHSNELAIERTYPDEAHGSLIMSAVPPGSTLLKLPLLAGGWLSQEDADAVVLTHAALDFFPGAKLGDKIPVTVGSQRGVFKIAGIAKESMALPKIYISSLEFQKFVPRDVTFGRVRISLDKHDALSIDDAGRAIERELRLNGIRISEMITENMLSKVIEGHIAILIFVLLAVAAVMGFVGKLGLLSAMSMSVIERYREFGILRVIGGKPSVVRRHLVYEGLFVGLLSWVTGMLLSMPLSAAFGAFLGNMSFGEPLPFALSPVGLIAWMAIIAVGAVAASAYPAGKAMRLPIRETLAML
jgi:putative ABC transport system permease protein